MTNKKRSVLIITTVALSLLLVVGATLAWLSDTRTAHNIIKIGEDGAGNTAIKMVLDEPNFRKEIVNAIDGRPTSAPTTDYGELEVYDWQDNDQTSPLDNDQILAKPDFEANVIQAYVYNYMPAQKIKKDPGTKNVGKIPVYLRFKLTQADGTVIEQSSTIWSTLTNPPNDPAVDAGLGLEIHPDFKYNATDHYYYYETAGTLETLDVDETASFFKEQTGGHTLEVPAGLGSGGIAAINTALNFKVAAEVVQTEGLNTTAPWADSNGAITLD